MAPNGYVVFEQKLSVASCRIRCFLSSICSFSAHRTSIMSLASCITTWSDNIIYLCLLNLFFLRLCCLFVSQHQRRWSTIVDHIIISLCIFSRFCWWIFHFGERQNKVAPSTAKHLSEPLDKPTFKDRRIKHIDLVMPPNEVDQCTAKAQKALFVVEYNQRHSKYQIFTLCMDSSQCQLENRWRVSRGHFHYIFDVLSVVACVAEPWFIPRSPFVDFEKRST